MNLSFFKASMKLSCNSFFFPIVTYTQVKEPLKQEKM